MTFIWIFLSLTLVPLAVAAWNATPREEFEYGLCTDDAHRSPRCGPRVVSKNVRKLAKWLKSNTINPVHPSVGLRKTFWLLYHFTWELLWWLRAPGVWCIQLFRLVMFTMMMLPGFIPPFLNYLVDGCIVKNIPYGKSMRQLLDVYLPYDPEIVESPLNAGKYPVVVFISGGAWIIGYKVWGFIMGQLLAKSGVICVTPDYRNFPQAAVEDMCEDIDRSIDWVLQNVEKFGGDLKQVTLVGQSAGAHLSALVLLRKIRAASTRSISKASVSTPSPGTDRKEGQNWKVASLANWVGISGPYDIEKTIPVLHSRGMHKRILKGLFTDVNSQSPVHYLNSITKNGLLSEEIINSAPLMHLFHGTSDVSVDCEQSAVFAKTLNKAGFKASCTMFKGKSHTDPILEDPLSGPDQLTSSLLRVVKSRDNDPATPRIRHCQPKAMLKVARWFNPF